MKAELSKTMDYLKSQLNDQAVVTKLQQYISDLEKQVEYLDSKREQEKEEYLTLNEKLKETDYELENHKRWLKVAGDELNEVKKEIKPLKELVKLWA